MRTNVTRQFRSRERKSTMWSFRSRERKCMGTKRPGTTGSPLTPRCKKHGAAEHLQQIRKIVGAFEFMNYDYIFYVYSCRFRNIL